MDVDARTHVPNWRKRSPVGFATGEAKLELVLDMQRGPMEMHGRVISGHILFSVSVMSQVVTQDGFEGLPCVLIDIRMGHFKSREV